MIPFFAVDRPVSLEILKGLFFKYPNLQFGLMTHANVSTNFTKIFSRFPYSTKLKYFDDNNIKIGDKRKINKIIKENVIKMADSGVFQKNGNNMSYPDLFEKYKKLRVEFGIIKDVIHDKDSTLKSAMEAIETYESNDYPEAFKLVGVAQGKSVEDYVACYEKLLDMGYKYIAIGGLLKRNANTNYVRVRCETFLKKVLEAINKEFNPEWLFVLGAYHPKRHELLESFNVWGSDYKGWLYCYDESYGDSIRELMSRGMIDSTVEEIYNKFIEFKRKYFRAKQNCYRIKYFQLRKWLDERLRTFGLSLQELRFREVRKNLEQNVISKML